MNDLISVVVLSYNSSKTILETLESIKRQTYTNLEVLICDDASTDDSCEIIQNWLDVNKEVNGRLLKAEINGGIPKNCNRGVVESKGVAIKFIAGDDLLFDNAIEVFYQNYLSSDSNEVCQSKVELFGSYGAVQEDYCSKSYYLLKKGKQLKRLLKSNFIVAPSVGLIDRNIFTKYGMFDERFQAFEDYPFYIKLSSNGFKFKLIDETLVRYRINSSSTSNGLSPRYIQSMVNFFFKVKFKLLIKNLMLITAIKQLLRYSIMKIKIKK